MSTKSIIRIICAVAVCVVLGACAYNQPIKRDFVDNTTIVALPYDTAWARTLTVLMSQSAAIKLSDKTNGLITTDQQPMRLTEEYADCGSVLGLPYIKDHRTTVYVSYAVHLAAQGDRTVITVNTNMKGLFNPSAISENKTLTCHSVGQLEKDLLAMIGKP